MKPTDLMIKDWVMVKVLSQIPNTYVLHTWAANDYSRNLQVEPIPLTTEILEKNGWVYTEYCHEYQYGKNIIQSRLPYMWIRINGIHIEDFKCEYVHQYQHLLRLCGLNELANNFKVV